MIGASIFAERNRQKMNDATFVEFLRYNAGREANALVEDIGEAAVCR